MSKLPLVSPLDRALFLKSQPYLAGLSSRSLAALAEHTEERHFSAGDVICAAGALPQQVYFLASGAVRTKYDGAPAYDAHAPSGVGLIGYFSELPGAPEIVALEDTFSLALECASLVQIIEDDFLLYSTIVAGLTRAVQETMSANSAVRYEQGFTESQMLETYVSLDLVQRLAMAAEAPFFAGSNLTVLTQLLRTPEPRRLSLDEVLWSAGSPVESMALVLDGSVVASGGGSMTGREAAQEAVHEMVHPAGSMVGAWEILSEESRFETARCASPARILEIDSVLFVDLLEDHSEFCIDYLGKLSRRLVELRTSGTHEVSDSSSGRDSQR